MIITLLSWMYITAVCLVWGNMMLHPFLNKNVIQLQVPQLPLLCFTGMAGIGTGALLLSIFMPLSALAHTIITLPAALYLLNNNNRKRLWLQCTTLTKQLSLTTWLLFACCIAVILFINTASIVHPDTLAYHTQAIHLMEQYKAIPGIVHLKYETAMTSMWFAIQAIFRFNFIRPNNYLFANGCVVSWFCLFVCIKLAAFKYDKQARVNNGAGFMGWLLLLTYCFIDWTQVRLTAASASPDFITALYIWAALYALLKSNYNKPNMYTWLSLLFCCTAIAIKLSAIAIGLLVVIFIIHLVKGKQFTTAVAVAGGAVLMLLPYLVRNIISSGYLLFPSALGNWLPVSWQLNERALHQFQHYITAYARFPVDSYDNAEKALALPFTQWVPLWWQSLSSIAQGLMVAIVLLLVINIIKFKTGFYQLTYLNKILLAVSLAGSIFWFMAAPAFRFGTGFLIPLLYGLCITLKNSTVFLNKPVSTGYFKTAVFVLGFSLLLYADHRTAHFWMPSQWVRPIGVQITSYRIVNFNGVPVTIADTCGFAPSPCNQNYNGVILRGKDINAGFLGR